MNKILVLAMALLFVAACTYQTGQTQVKGGTETVGTQPASETGGSVAKVEIVGFAFNPQTLTVPVGTTVEFLNKDTVPHTVTSDAGDFDSPTLKERESFKFLFNEKGTFSYHCSIHTSMKGTIVVE